MYEGWHVELTRHARQRLEERLVDQRQVRLAVAKPDWVRPDPVHGGKLLGRYLPELDKILIVALEERPNENLVLVKTVLWSQES